MEFRRKIETSEMMEDWLLRTRHGIQIDYEELVHLASDTNQNPELLILDKLSQKGWQSSRFPGIEITSQTFDAGALIGRETAIGYLWSGWGFSHSMTFLIPNVPPEERVLTNFFACITLSDHH